MQHFIGRYSRYSRYRTKTHDKSTISHVFPRYSRYQTVFLKLQEIIKKYPQGLLYGIHLLGGCLLFFLLYMWAPFDHPASSRDRHSIALSFNLKTAHRGCFLRSNSSQRDNFDLVEYKKCSTTVGHFLLSLGRTEVQTMIALRASYQFRLATPSYERLRRVEGIRANIS